MKPPDRVNARPPSTKSTTRTNSKHEWALCSSSASRRMSATGTDTQHQRQKKPSRPLALANYRSMALEQLLETQIQQLQRPTQVLMAEGVDNIEHATYEGLGEPVSRHTCSKRSQHKAVPPNSSTTCPHAWPSSPPSFGYTPMPKCQNSVSAATEPTLCDGAPANIRIVASTLLQSQLLTKLIRPRRALLLQDYKALSPGGRSEGHDRQNGGRMSDNSRLCDVARCISPGPRGRSHESARMSLHNFNATDRCATLGGNYATLCRGGLPPLCSSTNGPTSEKTKVLANNGCDANDGAARRVAE